MDAAPAGGCWSIGPDTTTDAVRRLAARIIFMAAWTVGAPRRLKAVTSHRRARRSGGILSKKVLLNS
jgi:hypothetical protein